jgi:hypothetical protein
MSAGTARHIAQIFYLGGDSPGDDTHALILDAVSS